MGFVSAQPTFSSGTKLFKKRLANGVRQTRAGGDTATCLDMNIDQLHIFREIALCSSVSQASRNLFISQSSLSRTLKNLENDIGVELFNRSGKKLELNRCGEILLRYANEAESSRAFALSEIRELQARKNNSVRVLFQHPFGNTPHAFRKLLSEHPELSPSINWINQPEGETLDLEYRVEQKKLPGFTEIGKDYLMLACSRRNPLSSKKYVLVDELKTIPLVYFTSSNLSSLIESNIERRELDIVFPCPQIGGALQLVNRDMGCLVGIGATTLNGINRDSELAKIPIVDFPYRPVIQYRATQNSAGQNDATSCFAQRMKEYLEAQLFYDNNLYRHAIEK